MKLEQRMFSPPHGRQTRAGEPGGLAPQLAICVSCVGRRKELGQRVEEETEIVREPSARAHS